MVDIHAALPDVTVSLRLASLEAPIEIVRDGFGIPHVRAQTAHDGFFGQGFATAQDWLWQMDFDRLRAYGRAAEYIGIGAVAVDRKMRLFQIARDVETDYQSLDVDTRAMLEAFASGVNAFIDTSASLPFEYALIGRTPEPWRAQDSLAVQRFRHSPQGVYEHKLWRARLVRSLGAERTAELLVGYEPGYPLIVPPEALYHGPAPSGLEELRSQADELDVLAGGGSNNLAIAGERTRSGKPLVAGDPHRALEVPNIYYQMHVACPQFDAIGLTFAGVPGFCNFGHNAHVAWSLTHGMADEQDLFIERFDPDKPWQYERDGEWLQAAVRRETVSVRDGSPEQFEVTVTRHGPVIAGEPSSGHAIALQQTTTWQPNTTFVAIRKMLEARSADELEETMRPWVSPVQNLVFADVNGDIGFLLRGKIPIRPKANAWVPVPGWSGRYDWQGVVPFERMPRSRNPDTGYIVTANNRIVESSEPYISLDFAPGYRAQRLSERIRDLREAGVEEAEDLLRDVVSVPAGIFRRLIGAVKTDDAHVMAARDWLLSWDGSMDRDAAAPAIYTAFRRSIDRILMPQALGQMAGEALDATGGGAANHARRLKSYIVRLAGNDDTGLLPPGSDWPSVCSEALTGAVEELRSRLGDDMASWRWERVHATSTRHPLSLVFPELAESIDPSPVGMLATPIRPWRVPV